MPTSITPETLIQLVNIAGPQRTHCQRILLHLLLAKEKNLHALEIAEESIENFDRGHRLLVHGNSELPGLFNEELKGLFMSPKHYARDIESFIQRCRKITQAIRNDTLASEQEIHQLVDSSPVLFECLNAILEAYQQATTEHLQQIRQLWSSERSEIHQLLEQVSKVSFEFSIVALNARVLAAQGGNNARSNDQRAFSAVSEQMSSLAININDLVKKALEKPQAKLSA